MLTTIEYRQQDEEPRCEVLRSDFDFVLGELCARHGVELSVDGIREKYRDSLNYEVWRGYMRLSYHKLYWGTPPEYPPSSGFYQVIYAHPSTVRKEKDGVGVHYRWRNVYLYTPEGFALWLQWIDGRATLRLAVPEEFELGKPLYEEDLSEPEEW